MNELVKPYVAQVSTFRIGQSNLFASPKTKICSLKLLRNQSVELLGRAETCAHLQMRTISVLAARIQRNNIRESIILFYFLFLNTSFSYWISSIALELPRSCITDSACFNRSSRFIVLWKEKSK